MYNFEFMVAAVKILNEDLIQVPVYLEYVFSWERSIIFMRKWSLLYQENAYI